MEDELWFLTINKYFEFQLLNFIDDVKYQNCLNKLQSKMHTDEVILEYKILHFETF